MWANSFFISIFIWLLHIYINNVKFHPKTSLLQYRYILFPDICFLRCTMAASAMGWFSTLLSIAIINIRILANFCQYVSFRLYSFLHLLLLKPSQTPPHSPLPFLLWNFIHEPLHVHFGNDVQGKRDGI